MAIRITGGVLRGRLLSSPPGLEVRPTGSRTREAVCNILAGQIEGARVLDLYAGSGVMGLEFASRGASRVVQVENDRRRVELLRRQAGLLVPGIVEVVCTDAMRYLADSETAAWDILYMDPPFTKAYPDPSLQLRRILASGGVAVCERPTGCKESWMDGADDHRAYGVSTLTFFYT